MNRTPRTRARIPRSLALAVGLLLAATACSSGGGSDSSATTTSSPPGSTAAGSATTGGATSTTSGSTTTTSSASTTTAAPTTTRSLGGRCSGAAPVAPAGAVTKTIVDVDGDGTPDKGWLGATPGNPSSVRFAILPSTGGGAYADFNSASPVARSVLVADADGKSPAEVFFDDGRLVDLYVYLDCKIQPVTNPQHQPYTFGLGFTSIGTGVGCANTSEGQRLVGLNEVGSASNSGSSVRWSRTIVELSGTTAHNGTITRGTYARPADDAKIALLSEVTCGKLTLADGLTYDG